MGGARKERRVTVGGAERANSRLETKKRCERGRSAGTVGTKM